MYSYKENCRSCLVTDVSMLSMDSTVDASVPLNVSDCFRVHLNVKITADDGLPQKICLNCFDTLISVRKFHLKCLHSQEYLLERSVASKGFDALPDRDSSGDQALSGKKKELAEASTSSSVLCKVDAYKAGTSQAAVSHIPPMNAEKENLVANLIDSIFIPKLETIDEYFSSEEIDGTGLDAEIFTENEDPLAERSINKSLDKKRTEIAQQTVATSSQIRPKSFPCLQCYLEFDTKNNLRVHFHAEHGEDNANGFCIQCSKKFSSRGQLMIHLVGHQHSKERLKCDYCGRQFNSKMKLVLHQRVHTGERPYMCSVCGKRFAQTSTLRTHMSLHTGKTFECPRCDKKFSRTSMIKVHMRAHDDIRPYECHLCDKKYRMKSHLNAHMSSHSKTRNFTCELCGQSYKTKSLLRNHMDVHSKPYRCPKCPFRASRLYIFRTHLVKVHGIHDDPKQFQCQPTN